MKPFTFLFFLVSLHAATTTVTKAAPKVETVKCPSWWYKLIFKTPKKMPPVEPKKANTPLQTDHSLATPMDKVAFRATYGKEIVDVQNTHATYDGADNPGLMRAFLVRTGPRSDSPMERIVGFAKTLYKEDEPGYKHWLEINTTDEKTYYVPFSFVVFYTLYSVPPKSEYTAPEPKSPSPSAQ